MRRDPVAKNKQHLAGDQARLLALIDLIEQFAGKRVLVVGDMVADEYIFGSPFSVSREAPVLVLRHRAQNIVPGGAINPGVNARTLGAEVFLAGVIGDDAPGDGVRACLRDYGVEMAGLFTEPGRPTSTKTRILAGDAQLAQQQIVRVDRIDRSDLGDECKRRIIAYVHETLPTVDALILSDYENGVISPEILEAAMPTALRMGKIVVVDSHGDLDRFQGVTALTPNQPEAEAAVGWKITDLASLERAGARLLEMTTARTILITRGSEGMSLFQQDRAPLHLPARSVEVADPTGAGDTVAATFTLALTTDPALSEARVRDGALLANIAASLVVQHVGCATNTASELAAAVRALARKNGADEDVEAGKP